MPRKKWQARTEITPTLLKFREKRKWQINLRRYVIEKSPCPFYAPYFGLDILNIRKWFEYQFTPELNWENFAEKWQFDHVIPVSYFDHDEERELRLCWNFTNLRIESLHQDKNQGRSIDVLGAKSYFDELFSRTGFWVTRELRDKIARIEKSQLLNTEPQQKFLTNHKEYLEQLESYSTLEFELLNRGRSMEEVRKELEFLKKNIQS